MVKEKSDNMNASDWILGFGWDQTLWNNNKFPTKNILNDLNHCI